jgi:uridine kinase
MVYVIAIAGGSGAGKTTIARKLAALLGETCILLPEDDYYRCRTTFTGFDASTHDFDDPQAKDHALLAEHLESARRGEAFQRPLYDFVGHARLAETALVEPRDFIVLEGLHVLASPRVRAAIDLAVFVEADEPLRLARRLERDVNQRGRSAVSVRRQFFRTVRPAHAASVVPQRAYADLVLVSTSEADRAEPDELATRIFHEVRTRLAART